MRNSLYGVYNISEGPVPLGTGPSRLCVVICRKLHTVDFCAILVALPFPFWHQKGVRTDELNFSQLSRLVNFLVAVAAQVTANYLCKWLDSHRKGK